MDHSEVLATVVALVAPFAEKGMPEIDEKTELTSQLALDSVKVMDLVVAVEDHFDISIALNALADVQTVGDLARLVERTLDTRA